MLMRESVLQIILNQKRANFDSHNTTAKYGVDVIEQPDMDALGVAMSVKVMRQYLQLPLILVETADKESQEKDRPELPGHSIMQPD